MKQITLVLLCLAGRARGEALLELLEPERVADGMAVHVKTRNFHPSLGDMLMFQLASDSHFTLDLQTRFTTNETVLYQDLSQTTWFVRARVLDEDGNPRSSWAVSRFELLEPVYPKPSVLVLEEEPVTQDQLTLVWPPSPEVATWEVAVSMAEPDAPSLYYQTPQTVFYLDLSPWRGEGVLWVKVRAIGETVNGPWSDLTAVAFQRPQHHHYSLAHLPMGGGWRAWLQVETLSDPDPEVWMTYRDLHIQGAPTRTRLDLNDGNGGVRRILMTDVTRGAPVLITSSAKLNLSLTYEHHGVHAGGYQLQEHGFPQRANLAGLPEDQDSLSAVVAVNHGQGPMEITFLLTARDWTTAAYVTDQEVTLSLEPMTSRAFLLRDYFPDGPPTPWAVSVKAWSDVPGLELIGAHFTLSQDQVTSHWRQAVTP